MDLRAALLQAEFQGLTDQQALAYGNESVVVSRDTTPYTWSGIGQKLVEHGVSPTDLVQLATNISSLPGGPVLDKCLTSGGFDFSDEFNRATIQSFEINEPDWAVNVLNAMLAIGVTPGTRWQLFGVAQPILSDIAAARTAIANQASKTRLMNEVVNAMASDESVTLAAFKAAIADWNA